MLAIPFPNIDPAIFTVDLFGMSFSLRWYALAYIAGLVLAWRYVIRLVRQKEIWRGAPPMTPDQPEELLTWMVIGVIAGGRLGFVLFYQPGYFLDNPSQIPVIWEGGMSFHGGFIGVIVGVILYARSRKIPVLSVGDAVACAAPIGLLLGRVANFINAELWGRPTTQPWGVVFPGERAQTCPDWWTEAVCARHPSQLYEATLEGAVLFVLMWWLATRAGWLKKPGRLIGVFFLGYGLARSIVENFRLADAQFITQGNPWGQVIRLGTGPEAFGLTMGQVLSLPMIAIGLGFLWWANREAGPPAAP
jgi:phosphatidylglycerol:prolipoprotein diacylglycerol transferase